MLTKQQSSSSLQDNIDETTERAEDTSEDLRVLMDSCKPIDLTDKITINNSADGVPGGFATVYKGLLNNKEVAVKVSRFKRKRPKPAPWEHSLERRIKREIKVWAAVSHPNILPFLGYAREFGDFLTMVSPWCSLGDASSYLDTHRDIRFDERIQLLLDVCEGLAYLHKLGVIHGDLKLENVLISDQNRALLADFGLVRLANWEGEAGMTTTSPYRATPRYTAPELLILDQDPNLRATMSGDVWAVGCLALEFLVDYQPYQPIHKTNKLQEAMNRGQLPAELSDLQKLDSSLASMLWSSLFVHTWQLDPAKRPSVASIQATVIVLRDTARLQGWSKLSYNAMEGPVAEVRNYEMLSLTAQGDHAATVQPQRHGLQIPSSLSSSPSSITGNATSLSGATVEESGSYNTLPVVSNTLISFDGPSASSTFSQSSSTLVTNGNSTRPPDLASETRRETHECDRKAASIQSETVKAKRAYEPNKLELESRSTSRAPASSPGAHKVGPVSGQQEGSKMLDSLMVPVVRLFSSLKSSMQRFIS
ncbi:SubName: Full=Uncharacterized protein {ECO:0000313/EMBL:CCA75738.1} [Serendipita indica DSM 11827]|nr:SubName: Full=Uncharacterized protein {ECO:0000313/EMBL:CCA75738.1} [Serendipita indica DSM 11827]